MLQLLLDWLSKVTVTLRITGCWPTSRSHGNPFIYLGLSAASSPHRVHIYNSLACLDVCLSVLISTSYIHAHAIWCRAGCTTHTRGLWQPGLQPCLIKYLDKLAHHEQESCNQGVYAQNWSQKCLPCNRSCSVLGFCLSASRRPTAHSALRLYQGPPPPRLADLALQPPRIYNAVLCTFMCYKFGAPYNVWNSAWWRHLWGRWNFKGLSAPTHGIGLSNKFHSLLNMLIPSVLWQCWLDVPMHEGQKDLFYCCCWCIFYA